jgi:hypothetical protein
VQLEDVYMVLFEFEFVVIQKKFAQYYAMDNVYKKTRECKVMMAYNSNLIATISNKILEINLVQVSDNKVHSELIEFIDLATEEDRDTQEAVTMGKLRCLIEEGVPQQKKLEQVAALDSLKEKREAKSELFCMWVTIDPLMEQHRRNIGFLFEVSHPDCKNPSY